MRQMVAGFEMPTAWAIRTPAPQPKLCFLDKPVLSIVRNGPVATCTMVPAARDGSCEHGFYQCSTPGCDRFVAPQYSVIGTMEIARSLQRGPKVADVFLRAGVWAVHRYLNCGDNFTTNTFAVSHVPSGIRASWELSFTHAVELCKRIALYYPNLGLNTEFGHQPRMEKETKELLSAIIRKFYEEKGLL